LQPKSRSSSLKGTSSAKAKRPLPSVLKHQPTDAAKQTLLAGNGLLSSVQNILILMYLWFPLPSGKRRRSDGSSTKDAAQQSSAGGKTRTSHINCTTKPFAPQKFQPRRLSNRTKWIRSDCYIHIAHGTTQQKVTHKCSGAAKRSYHPRHCSSSATSSAEHAHNYSRMPGHHIELRHSALKARSRGPPLSKPMHSTTKFDELGWTAGGCRGGGDPFHP
jgi:hypothetical protein